MKVAILQVPYCKAIESIQWQKNELDQLAEVDVDLVVLPEYCNATAIENKKDLLAFLDAHGDSYIQEIRTYAKKINCAIAAGVILRDENNKIRNRLLLIGNHGNTVGYSDKIHLPQVETDMGICAGEQVNIIEYQGLRIASAICFDIYFAEYFSMLSHKNVDLIIAPAYQRAESAQRIIALSQVRAIDAGAFLVRASYSVDNSENFAGRSLLVAPNGKIIDMAQGDAKVLSCEIDPKNKFIKPASYGKNPINHITLINQKRRSGFYRHKNNSKNTPAVSAHRGLSGSLPENTIAAFAAAIASGVDEIEFDVSLTKDNIPVIFHDPDLNRVANVNHKITDMTWDEIQEVDLSSVYGEQWKHLRIPRLEELLDICDGSVGLNIHIKDSGENGAMIKIVSQELGKRNLVDCAYIGGEKDVIEDAIKWASHIARCCMIKQDDSDELIENAIKYNCQRLQFFSTLVNENHIKKAHLHNIHCNIFYANTFNDFKNMAKIGADTILSDYAIAAIKYRQLLD